MTKRFFRVGQYDGIHDFIAFELSGKKGRLSEILVGKFDSSAICQRFDPLVAHSAPPSGDSVEMIRLDAQDVVNLFVLALGTLFTKPGLRSLIASHLCALYALTLVLAGVRGSSLPSHSDGHTGRLTEGAKAVNLI